MKINLKFLAAAMILSSSFFSCNVNVGDPTKVYVCSTCGHEYNTKEEAQNCKLNSDGNQNNGDSGKIYICLNCFNEYSTKEKAIKCDKKEGCPEHFKCEGCNKGYRTKFEADNCEAAEGCPKYFKCEFCHNGYKTLNEAQHCKAEKNCPDFYYTINYVWNDFEMYWRAYIRKRDYADGTSGYTGYVTSHSSGTTSVSKYFYSGSYDMSRYCTNKDGELQKRFIAEFIEDETYSSIDLKTFDWIDTFVLASKIKPDETITMPEYSVNSITAVPVIDNHGDIAYTTKLTASLKFYSDSEFKHEITELKDITEDTTIYIRIFGEVK